MRVGILVLALATGLLAAPEADAKRTTTAVVTVVNQRGIPAPAWSVTARLATRSTVRTVSGGRQAHKGRALTLRAGRRAKPLPASGTTRLRVRIRGGAPTRWRASAGRDQNDQRTACKVLRTTATGRSPATRLAVRCVLERTPLDSAVVGPAPGTGRFVFAPYLYVDDDLDLAAALRDSRTPSVTFAFVVSGGGCAPRWDSESEPPAGTVGPGAIVSFGGAAGTELAVACTDVDALTAAYQSIVTRYGVTSLDFDVEGGALGDAAANARRAQAIARLKAANPGLQVSFTLPVLPTGLDEASLALLRGAVAAGATPDLVNVMAMDYGIPSTPGRMGMAATEAGDATVAQLQQIIPGASYATLGVTPMIGVNDVAAEVFTVDDAQLVRAWAITKGVGRLSMWALQRDRPCATPKPTTQGNCSGVDQAPWTFTDALGRP